MIAARTAVSICLASLLACFALALVCQDARADVDSPVLAKFAQPLDAAVTKGLEYLARKQKPDGSFETGMPENSGIHGLAIMAFLARGHTPGNGPYGEVINKGIDYILKQQHGETGLMIRSGNSHGAMYNHGICTLLLAECSGMVDPERQKKIDQALPKAVKVILAAQAIHKPDNYAGGWRYQMTSNDSDISVTGWVLMALRSCRNNGAPVPIEAIDKPSAMS